MLASVVRLSVPDLFAGMRIEIDSTDGLAPIAVRGGVLGGSENLLVALQSGGETFGRLVVARRWGRQLDDLDRLIAADIGTRIALALNSARALARERNVANTLQRALLPDTLPQGERVRTSAAYLPGTKEAIVGGDWYDIFDLPDGRMAFSIGDVVGHGLRAAVVMGEVRQAVRAAAVDPTTPSVVLERANAFVNLRSDMAIVTAIFGIFDRDASSVTYAVAGHPPPILATRSGAAYTLPASGIPLGVAASLATVDWTFTLPPGSLFALYTDGLTEHSRDLALGEEQLKDAIRAQLFTPSGNPARHIVDSIFGTRQNVDDVAALVLAVADTAPEYFTFDFSAVPFAVSMLRRELARYLQARGLTEDDTFAAMLAVGEAAANAVEHAYASEPGLVRVRAECTGATLIAEVHDWGHWKRAKPADERGRGIKLMRSLMDRVEIRTLQAETTVRLTLLLRSASHANPGNRDALAPARDSVVFDAGSIG